MKAVKPQWPPCFTATAGLAASMNRVLREFVSGQWWHKSSIQHCRVGLRPFLLCLPHWLAVPAGGATVVAYWCWWQYKYWWWRWQETEAWNYNPDDQSVMLNVFSLSHSFFSSSRCCFYMWFKPDTDRFGFHGALRDHNEMPGEKRGHAVAQDDT